MTIGWILLQAAAGGAAQPAPANFLVSLLPFVVIFAIMYFFLIRPQSKKAKEHQKLLESITSGTEIVTTGGMHGVVKGTKGQNNEILVVQIADGIKIEIDRAAVGRVKGNESK